MNFLLDTGFTVVKFFLLQKIKRPPVKLLLIDGTGDVRNMEKLYFKFYHFYLYNIHDKKLKVMK